MEGKFDKTEIEKIKQKLKVSLDEKQNNQIRETSPEKQINFSTKESIDILKKIKVKNNLLESLDAGLGFGEKQYSLTSYFFNKKISQKYLNALKLYILTEPLEKQNQINELLIDLVIELINKLEILTKSKTEQEILSRLEKIEKNMSK